MSRDYQNRSRRIRRGLAYILMAWSIYVAVFAGAHSAIDAWKVRRQRERIEKELANLRIEAERLRATIDSLENVPHVIERIARERYGMIRDGEILVRFVTPDRNAIRDGMSYQQ